MEKNYKCFLFIVLVFLCTACKTTGQFTGSAPLTVMIVDENGMAVRDFKVTLSNFNNSENGITNAGGMCTFNNIPAGQYELAGQKSGYSSFEEQKISFTNRCDVFCFRVLIGNCIVVQAASLLDSSNYQEGFDLLDKLVCEKKSAVYATVCFYKAWGYSTLNDQKSMNRELRKMKSASKEFAEKYSVAVEHLKTGVEKIKMEDESE